MHLAGFPDGSNVEGRRAANKGGTVSKMRAGGFGRIGRVGWFRSMVVGLVVSGGLVAFSGNTADGQSSTPGVTSKTITIGMINDTTGVAASTFADGVGTAEARIALQNAEGGVDGRKLKLIVLNSESSGTTLQTAAQELVGDGVFGVVVDSAFTFSGSTYLTQQGVPVTGDTFDGPEWGTAANMFSYGPPTYTPYNGTYYGYDEVSILLKKLGVKRVAVLAYNYSPSAVTSAKETAAADTKAGLQNCYENLSVPFGSVDFTADVLQMKAQHCDAAIGTFVAASNVALASAIQNAGLKMTQFYYTSYDQTTLQSSAAEHALDGTYSEGLVAAGHTTTEAATAKFYAALKKYDPSYPGGVPDLGATNSWDGMDVMIEGLKLAGPHPTRAAFISKLRTVKTYTIGGLSASPIDFNYLSGKFPSTQCANFVVLKGTKFDPYPANGAVICGGLVPLSG
ncbi:MAG TPA: ABC transporter substrate-binding protein [Acidimicrobiales bacterium]|nr:ABC transporter substrate-binding protein [Acidimicrobiales bacterium]